MDLTGKNILVVGATGGVGSGTARLLAARGAHVWLAARGVEKLDKLAAEIGADGGRATAAPLDATDPAAVDAYVDVIADRSRLDGVFTAVGAHPTELGYPARSETLAFSDFMAPQRLILGSSFLAARSAARRMIPAGGGSIVLLSASLSGTTIPWMAALTATCGAIEAMTRSLSAEYGPAGVRVNCVRGDAMPETETIRATGAGSAALAGGSFDLPPTPLGRPITVAETACTVAFLLSDAASGITSQTVNVSGNALV